jgi:hypothetical protein
MKELMSKRVMEERVLRQQSEKMHQLVEANSKLRQLVEDQDLLKREDLTKELIELTQKYELLLHQNEVC